MSYLGIFWLELEKATALCFFKLAPSNFFKQNFVQKKKSLNLGPKLPYWIFWTGISKNVKFEISIFDLEFVT